MNERLIFKATPTTNSSWSSKAEETKIIIGWNIYKQYTWIDTKDQSLISKLLKRKTISIKKEDWSHIAFVKTEKEIEKIVNHLRLEEKIYN